MVSVKNTAVNLTAALLRIICLSLLSSLLYICGFQQFYYEVTGVVFFVFTGLVNLWVVSFNSFRKFSGIIFISVVSPQFSHKRPFHCYLTPALSANFCFWIYSYNHIFSVFSTRFGKWLEVTTQDPSTLFTLESQNLFQKYVFIYLKMFYVIHKQLWICMLVYEALYKCM